MPEGQSRFFTDCYQRPQSRPPAGSGEAGVRQPGSGQRLPPPLPLHGIYPVTQVKSRFTDVYASCCKARPRIAAGPGFAGDHCAVSLQRSVRLAAQERRDLELIVLQRRYSQEPAGRAGRGPAVRRRGAAYSETFGCRVLRRGGAGSGGMRCGEACGERHGEPAAARAAGASSSCWRPRPTGEALQQAPPAASPAARCAVPSPRLRPNLVLRRRSAVRRSAACAGARPRPLGLRRDEAPRHRLERPRGRRVHHRLHEQRRASAGSGGWSRRRCRRRQQRGRDRGGRGRLDRGGWTAATGCITDAEPRAACAARLDALRWRWRASARSFCVSSASRARAGGALRSRPDRCRSPPPRRG